MTEETETAGVAAPKEGAACSHQDNMLAKDCLACELEQGERVAKQIAEVMREEGLEEPADQFGTMLGLATAGFARGGTDLEVLLEAVRAAYGKASGDPSSG